MSSLRLLASGATARGNAVVEETRARAVRRAVKSCIVEVAQERETQQTSQVRCGGKGNENKEEWDGMESLLRARSRSLLWGKRKRLEVLYHI